VTYLHTGKDRCCASIMLLCITLIVIPILGNQFNVILTRSVDTDLLAPLVTRLW